MQRHRLSVALQHVTRLRSEKISDISVDHHIHNSTLFEVFLIILSILISHSFVISLHCRKRILRQSSMESVLVR